MVAKPPEEDRDVTQNAIVGLAVATHILGDTAMIKTGHKDDATFKDIKGEVTKIPGLTPEKRHHYLGIRVRITILIMYFIMFYLCYLHLVMLIRHI